MSETTARFEIKAFRALNKGAVKGFVTVRVGTLIFHDCSVLSGKNGLWISLPSKPMIGRDDAVMKDPDGKRRYAPTVEFSDRDAADRFSASVLRALADAGHHFGEG